jgi:hypothetical protein
MPCHALGVMDELKKMSDRDVAVFSTKDHPKSKDLTFEIKYPKDWLSSEGNRPAILRKFHSEGGKGFLMLILNVVELPYSSEEISRMSEDEKYFAESDLPEMLPKGSKLLKVQRTRLEGEPCSLVEFQTVASNAGIDVTTNNLYFYVITGRWMVTIAGSLVKKPDQSDAQFNVEWQSAKLLFQSIASTFYLPQKWQEQFKAVGH